MAQQYCFELILQKEIELHLTIGNGQKTANGTYKINNRKVHMLYGFKP